MESRHLSTNDLQILLSIDTEKKNQLTFLYSVMYQYLTHVNFDKLSEAIRKNDYTLVHPLISDVMEQSRIYSSEFEKYTLAIGLWMFYGYDLTGSILTEAVLGNIGVKTAAIASYLKIRYGSENVSFNMEMTLMLHQRDSRINFLENELRMMKSVVRPILQTNSRGLGESERENVRTSSTLSPNSPEFTPSTSMSPSFSVEEKDLKKTTERENFFTGLLPLQFGSLYG